MVEDLSKFKNKPEPEKNIFDPSIQPELWAHRTSADAVAHGYSFGYPCAPNYLCLVPLNKNEVETERMALWEAPVCNTEEDAKRVFFLVDQLMNTLDAFAPE